MQDAKFDMLHDAISRNAGIVLSLPADGELRHHKSRFIAADDAGFWVESADDEAPLIDTLIASKQPAGVSFKNGNLKVIFASPVARRAMRPLNASTTVEALLLAFPTELKEVQRRSAYRAGIPADAGMSVRVWRLATGVYLGDRPSTAQEVLCDLRDISTGGLGVTLKGRDGQPPKVNTHDRLRIELSTPAGDKLLVEGRMRYPVDPITLMRARAGIQFKTLDASIGGREILAQLTRIVGEFQREEVRRLRLGLCHPAA